MATRFEFCLLQIVPRPGFIAESRGVDVLVERHPVGIIFAEVLDEARTAAMTYSRMISEL